MADIVPLILMLGALIALMLARGLLAAARDHVRAAHPDWFETLGSGGWGLRTGGPDERARRKLTRPLLLGRLPRGPDADPVLRRLAEHMRLMLLAALLCLLGLGLIIWLRGAGAAA